MLALCNIVVLFLALTWAVNLPLHDSSILLRDNSETFTPEYLYDAVIVGGGPAGLSALSGLARVRRNVLLLDSGEYRNAKTRHMHDVIGFDGVEPAYFRWAARQLLSHYPTVSMTNGTVTNISTSGNNTFFVTTTFQTEALQPKYESIVEARKIILATGLRDLLPNTPGLEENWGQGIFWCPWCDGNEHADQALGLLASLESIPSLVREILKLNTDIIAFVNGSDTPAMRIAAEKKFPQWEKFLQLHNVTVENRTISSITRIEDGTPHEDPSLPSQPQYDLFRVDFKEGRSVKRAAFLGEFPSEQRSNLGPELGVDLYGGRLAADPSIGLMTNFLGVYAIGDANSDNVTNVPHAIFSGKRTAVYLHVNLTKEDGYKELGVAQKRVMLLEEQSIWETMNGDSDDIFYAGEFPH